MHVLKLYTGAREEAKKACHEHQCPPLKVSKPPLRPRRGEQTDFSAQDGREGDYALQVCSRSLEVSRSIVLHYHSSCDFHADIRTVPTVRRLDVWPYAVAHSINLAMILMGCTRTATSNLGRLVRSNSQSQCPSLFAT